MPRLWNKGLRTLLAERLYRLVEVGEEEECWPFVGGWRWRFGYGRIWSGGQDGQGLQAPVAMCELLVGPVPTGMWLLHQCDTPLCCNPGHLRPGSASENRRDQFEHGALAVREAA